MCKRAREKTEYRPRIPLRALCEFIFYCFLIIFGLYLPFLGLRMDLLFLADHPNPSVRAGRGLVFLWCKQITGMILRLGAAGLRSPFVRLHVGLTAAANRALTLPLTVVQSRSWTSVGLLLATDWVAWVIRVLSAIPLFEGALKIESEIQNSRQDSTPTDKSTKTPIRRGRSEFYKLARFMKFMRDWIYAYHVPPPHGMSVIKSRMAFTEYESVVTTVGVFAVAVVFPFAYGMKAAAAGNLNSAN